jgi:hypothetical protein
VLLMVVFCELTGCCICLKLISQNMPEVFERNIVPTANEFVELARRHIPDACRLNVNSELKLLADRNYLCTKDKHCPVTKLTC